MASLPAYPGVVVESDRTVWEGRFRLQIIHFRHRRFDGTMSGERIWELWRRGRAAAMLPYDPWADTVVLMEQFRLPALAAGVDPVMVEVPAGLSDGDERPEETIAREMHEEIGLSADRAEPIGDFMLTPGGCDERCSLFVGRVEAPAGDADGLVGLSGLAAEQEDIRIRVVPAETAIAAAVDGHYPNSVTSLALLWLGHRREWLREHWKDR
jgi:ADP-ribose pyrophosphatase